MREERWGAGAVLPRGSGGSVVFVNYYPLPALIPFRLFCMNFLGLDFVALVVTLPLLCTLPCTRIAPYRPHRLARLFLGVLAVLGLFVLPRPQFVHARTLFGLAQLSGYSYWFY